MQDEGRAMTPRQQMALRKQQKADKEAEERRRIAAKNFSEGKRRFREHRKRQARVVPPWVEEHPDVFNDPEFSITQLDSTASGFSDTTTSAMDISLNPKPLALATEKGGYNGLAEDGGEMDMSIEVGGNRPPPLQLQDGGSQPPPLQLQGHGNQLPPLQSRDGGNRPPPLQLHGGGKHPPPLQPLSVEGIPEDPALAETHYSQFDDFEADESSYSESEDDYETD